MATLPIRTVALPARRSLPAAALGASDAVVGATPGFAAPRHGVAG